jgi:heterotetrameric sarcosine oxidase gamma subunit
MVDRNSALRGERIHGRFGNLDKEPGVTLQEIKDFSYLEIALWDWGKDSLRSKLAELLGISDLPEAGRSQKLSEGLLHHLGEGRLIYFGAAAPADILEVAITPEEGSVVPLGHGKCLLRLGGERVDALLRRGVRQDIRPGAFPVGAAMTTDIGGIDILLLRPDKVHYDLLIPRSHAVELWRWLTRRAAQFGYEVL